MGNNNEDLKFAAMPQVNDQFGKRAFLKKHFGKNTLIAVAVVGIALFATATGQKKVRTNRSMAITFPELRNKDGTLNFPLYLVSKDLETNRGYRSIRSISPQIFSGPKRFDRTDLSKIKIGTEIKATLVSGATDGSIKARVDFTGGSVKKGDLLIGKGASKGGRLEIRFTKLVHEDGAVQPIGAIAIDSSDRSSGLKGSDVSHYGWKTAAAAGLYFLGSVSAGLTEQQNMGGVPVAVPNLRNAALNGVSQATLELATQQMQKAQASKPRYKIPFGTKIIVLFTD